MCEREGCAYCESESGACKRSCACVIVKARVVRVRVMRHCESESGACNRSCACVSTDLLTVRSSRWCMHRLHVCSKQSNQPTLRSIVTTHPPRPPPIPHPCSPSSASPQPLLRCTPPLTTHVHPRLSPSLTFTLPPISFEHPAYRFAGTHCCNCNVHLHAQARGWTSDCVQTRRRV